jgi:hypothetical protein
MEYLLPWHGQLMVPPLIEDTVHPMWVQVEEKPSKVPALGWVMTMAWSGRITPPPTSTSDALVSTSSEPPGVVSPPPAGVVS